VSHCRWTVGGAAAGDDDYLFSDGAGAVESVTSAVAVSNSASVTHTDSCHQLPPVGQDWVVDRRYRRTRIRIRRSALPWPQAAAGYRVDRAGTSRRRRRYGLIKRVELGVPPTDAASNVVPHGVERRPSQRRTSSLTASNDVCVTVPTPAATASTSSRPLSPTSPPTTTRSAPPRRRLPGRCRRRIE